MRITTLTGTFALVVLPIVAFGQGPPAVPSPAAQEPLSSAATADSGAAAAVKAPAPRISVDRELVELGKLLKGETGLATFVVTNQGDATLELSAVSSSCECTVPSYPSSLVAGASGEIVAELASRTLDGPGETVLTLVSNDPERPSVRLTITAEVISFLQASPAGARWITSQGEPPGTLEIAITAKDGAAFDVESVETPTPYLLARYAALPEAQRVVGSEGGQWRLALTLSGEAPVGPVAGRVVVHTNHPKQKIIEIATTGFVRPRYHLSPESGDFGEVLLDRPKTRRYTFNNFGSAPIQVTAKTDVPGLEASVLVSKEGYRFKIELRLTELMKAGELVGVLTVQTDDPLIGTVRVPLSGNLILPSAETP